LRGASAYIQRSAGRQTGRGGALAAAAVLALALAGCSTLGLPFGPERAVDTRTVGAIPVNATSVDTVDPSDWETVRRSLAAVAVDKTITVEWANPDTGSTGTVTAIPVAGANSCRAFATTVSDPHGIRRYSGQLCRLSDGRWQIARISPVDAHFS
jgi:surface antigen